MLLSVIQTVRAKFAKSYQIVYKKEQKGNQITKPIHTDIMIFCGQRRERAKCLCNLCVNGNNFSFKNRTTLFNLSNNWFSLRRSRILQAMSKLSL